MVTDVPYLWVKHARKMAIVLPLSATPAYAQHRMMSLEAVLRPIPKPLGVVRKMHYVLAMIPTLKQNESNWRVLMVYAMHVHCPMVLRVPQIRTVCRIPIATMMSVLPKMIFLCIVTPEQKEINVTADMTP